MRRLLGIVMVMLAVAAYAEEPQDSVVVVQDTLQVLVEDSAGVMVLTDTIVEVETVVVPDDTIKDQGNILTGKYERLKDGTRIYSARYEGVIKIVASKSLDDRAGTGFHAHAHDLFHRHVLPRFRPLHRRESVRCP